VDVEAIPTTPASVIKTVTSQLKREGFTIVQEEGPSRHGHLLPQGQATVRGELVGERHLRLDRGLSRRLDRLRWVCMAAGVPLLAIGTSNLTLGTPHVAIPLAATFGLLILGSGLFTYPFVSMTNMDFWSDLVIVEYTAPFGSGPKTDESSERVRDLSVTITVGRARTENWQSKVEKGRSVKTILDDPGLQSVRVDLKAGLSSGQSLQ
jgi:hypothetical protein